MQKNQIIRLFFFAGILLQTTLSFGQTDSLKLKRIRRSRLVKNTIENYNTYDNCSYKINANTKLKDKKHKLNILYRNYKDSVIWINVSHNTGIPIARFLITPDSVKFLNRMDKNYMLLAIQDIQKAFGYNLDFHTIQSIFNAELIKLDDSKELTKNYRSYKVYRDSCQYLIQNIRKHKMNRLIKKDKLDLVLFHQVIINQMFRLVRNTVENNTNNTKLFVEYSDYKESNEHHYPKKITFSLKNETQEVDIRLKIKRAKYNAKKLSCSFKIPKKYEEKILDN